MADFIMNHTFRYYAGPEHHEAHLRFIRKNFPGELFVSGHYEQEKNTYDLIKDFDDIKAVWFFAHIYTNIFPFIKGKIVYVGHGLGYKPVYVAGNDRIELLKKYAAQAWAAGNGTEYFELIREFPSEKIKRIGYTFLYNMPKVETEGNSILFSVGWFDEIVSFQNALNFLTTFPDKVNLFVTAHPSLPEDKKNIIKNICREKDWRFTKTQDDLLEAYARCRCLFVGMSSVMSGMLYQGKPVIFMKDRNRFPFFQWDRLRLRIKSQLFFKMLRESKKILLPATFAWDLIEEKKISNAGKKIFLDSQWSRRKTVSLMKQAIDDL